MLVKYSVCLGREIRSEEGNPKPKAENAEMTLVLLVLFPILNRWFPDVSQNIFPFFLCSNFPTFFVTLNPENPGLFLEQAWIFPSPLPSERG